MSGRVYLDYNATAPVRPEAIAAMAAAWRCTGNASSVHADGRAARRLVEDARERIALLVGARPAEIVFTGSGTEANNQALRCSGRDHVIVSAIEHDSVRNASPGAPRIAVGADGVIALASLRALLEAAPAPALVSVMLANNETGVIQPVAEAARIAHDFGVPIHCDAVQAAGKIPLDMAALGVDYLSLSAHKLGGPQGVGCLVVRDGAPMAPLIHGGGQERGRRAGTEAVAAIAGFGAAADRAKDGLSAFAALAGLRDELERRIHALASDAMVIGGQAARLPNTSQIAVPGIAADTQVMALDLAGISVSAGAACSAGKMATPEVLLAMGVPRAIADCAIRVSLGWHSAPDDIDRLVAAFAALALRVRGAAA